MNTRERGESTLSRWLMAVIVALGGILAAAPDRALAQKGEPDPSVARLSFAEGDVSYLNADLDDEWAPVDVNAPLFAGDRFYAGDNAKAEIQLGPGAYVRLSSDTEIDLMDLGEQHAQVRVGLGTATFRLHDRARQELEISTPGAAIVAKAEGEYRVDVAEDGRTTVLVRDGEAEAFRDETRYQLSRGRGAEFDEVGYQQAASYDYEPVRVFDAGAVERDSWDQWEASRAARVNRSTSFQYVSGDVYGVEDLDEYGTWQRYDDYGPVWRPTNVAAGWSPFTDGRWVWQDPWGWTWVDYAPWGWAPSHYGRWVYVQNSWGWAPGPIVTRPVYSPAVVGFLGINTGAVSIGVGFGTGGGPSVGWVPLGYGEPVVPWWGGFGGVTVGQPWWGGWGGPRIVNNKVINKNITNININNINYTNIDRFGDGIPVATRDGFTRGEMRRLNLRGDELRNAVQPLRGAPEIVPSRESLFAARPERLRQGRAAQPRADSLDRAVVATREGGRVQRRASFDDKAKLIQERNGRALPPQELSRLAESSRRGREGIRTVRASGTRAVTPEVTAEAPRRAGERVQRSDVRGRRDRQQAAADASAPTGQETRQGLGRQPAGRDGSTERANANGRARDQIRQQRDERRATGEAQGDPQSELRENALRQRQERARVESEGGRAPAGGRGRERAASNESPRDAQQLDSSPTARRGTADQERQRDAAGEVERAQRAPTGRERPGTARPDENAQKAQRSAQGRERQDRAGVESQQKAQERASSAERATRGNAERAQREQVNRDQQERQRQSAAASESRSNEERAQRERAGREQQERARTESARKSSQERERQQAAERQSRSNQERMQREQAGRQRQEQERAESARRSSQERERQQAAERQARSNQERAQREQAGRQRQEQARAESARRSAQERDRQEAAERQARTNQERAQRQQPTRTESSSASRDEQPKKRQRKNTEKPGSEEEQR